MENVYVLGGLRSYIGIKNKAYKNIPAEILGAEVLKKVISKFNLKNIDCIISGNAVGGSGNISRLMMLEAGVNPLIPSFTIDMQCGSSLESIASAAYRIESKAANLIIAGGFESSSTQDLRFHSKNHPEYKEDSFYTVAKFVPGRHKETEMLEEAELICQKEKISKEELNYWAALSHRRAYEAACSNVLSDITTTIFNLEKDEGIRADMSERLLNRLPTSLENGEYITAGNACLMNDGAAFVVLCSEDYLKKYNLKPKAKILLTDIIGGNPNESPKTVNLTIKSILRKANLTINDIDCFECNEAFSLIDVLFNREFPKLKDKYNIFGGALAYGHPFAASGAMIFLHLIKGLEKTNGHRGICSVAASGGIGSSILIEKL